jgi:hypothetical protein
MDVHLPVLNLYTRHLFLVEIRMSKLLLNVYAAVPNTEPHRVLQLGVAFSPAPEATGFRIQSFADSIPCVQQRINDLAVSRLRNPTTACAFLLDFLQSFPLPLS